jgi:hypothetical protein
LLQHAGNPGGGLATEVRAQTETPTTHMQ